MRSWTSKVLRRDGKDHLELGFSHSAMITMKSFARLSSIRISPELREPKANCSVPKKDFARTRAASDGFDGITDPLIMLDNRGMVRMIKQSRHGLLSRCTAHECFREACFEGLRGRETNVSRMRIYPFPAAGREPITFERKGLIDRGKVEASRSIPVPGELGAPGCPSS